MHTTAQAVLPMLLTGTELAGELRGSGYREPPHLICRADSQLVRLPALLYVLTKALHAQHQFSLDVSEALSRVASHVSHETGIHLSPDQVVFLVDHKLAPLGITTYSDGSSPTLTKSNPILALRFKLPVLSARVTWMLGGLFGFLYQQFVMTFFLTAIVLCEVWALTTQDLAGSLQDALLNPASILLVVVLALVSSGFHEIGHATACRYSGVAPGPMGCGVYIVWPVFYTDVTNSYRLGRAGRLRTDLGGVYFNGIFVVALTLLYVWTGFTPLLVAILGSNIEMLQQLLPTLRFDGYYIVADLVGIPDLFRYMGPILKRFILRRPADEQLQLLKRRPQYIVSAWVLCVLPFLVAQLVYLVLLLPTLTVTLWQSFQTLLHDMSFSSGRGILTTIAGSVQIVLLLIPVAGIMATFFLLTRALLRFAHRQAQKRGTTPSGRHRKRPVL